MILFLFNLANFEEAIFSSFGGIFIRETTVKGHLTLCSHACQKLFDIIYINTRICLQKSMPVSKSLSIKQIALVSIQLSCWFSQVW